MFERFTRDARAAVVGAQDQARALEAPRIRPEHLLLGLAAEVSAASGALAAYGITVERLGAQLRTAGAGAPDALDAQALAALGIDLEQVRAAAEAQLGPGVLDAPAPDPSAGIRSRHLRFTGAAKQVLEMSLREALRVGAREIGADAVLLGLLRQTDVLPLLAAVGGSTAAGDLAAGAVARLQRAAA